LKLDLGKKLLIWESSESSKGFKRTKKSKFENLEDISNRQRLMELLELPELVQLSSSNAEAHPRTKNKYKPWLECNSQGTLKSSASFNMPFRALNCSSEAERIELWIQNVDG
jgi:hypothetical protein